MRHTSAALNSLIGEGDIIMSISYDDIGTDLRRIVISGRLDLPGTGLGRRATRGAGCSTEKGRGRRPVLPQVSRLDRHTRTDHQRQGGPAARGKDGAGRERELDRHDEPQCNRGGPYHSGLQERLRGRKGRLSPDRWGPSCRCRRGLTNSRSAPVALRCGARRNGSPRPAFSATCPGPGRATPALPERSAGERHHPWRQHGAVGADPAAAGGWARCGLQHGERDGAGCRHGVQSPHRREENAAEDARRSLAGRAGAGDAPTLFRLASLPP